MGKNIGRPVFEFVVYKTNIFNVAVDLLGLNEQTFDFIVGEIHSPKMGGFGDFYV